MKMLEENYLSDKQHDSLLAWIDEQVWDTTLQRRTQHYGYKYNYKNRSIDLDEDYLGLLPTPLQILADQLCKDYQIKILDQAIVNEYLPGQGVGDHIDCEPCFGADVFSVTLGAGCVMQLTNVSDDRFQIGLVKPIYLSVGSVLHLTGRSRYMWKHGIKAVKTDMWEGKELPRSRRVSITFRSVEKHPVDDTLLYMLRAEHGGQIGTTD